MLLQDNQEVFTSLYTMKWFFQCFLDRVSPAAASSHTCPAARASCDACFCLCPDPVHPDTQDLGHLHHGGGESAAGHVLHHPQTAQE